jgi:eukaryotic-like serine/threonine-protein kinase
MKEIINFFKNKTVQKHLLFAFGGLFIFINLIFLGLNVYTRHGQALSVPDFAGKNLEEASRMADEKRLRFEVTDSVFIQGQAPGTVVAQNPSVNTKVKANRTIFFTINAINPEKIEMPNLVNYPFRQAEAMLLSAGLRLGQVRYIPNVAKDYVLKQSYHRHEVAAGTRVIKGSAIDLTVGMGLGSSDIKVPHLKGLALEAAQEELSGKYLSFGAIIYDNSVETYMDSMKAVIWKQRPEYGSYVNMGGGIDVYLTVNETKVKTDSITKSDNE